jgi:hypothetical protein
MDLRSIIEEIAIQADDFLAGAANRKEARAGIDESINADHPQLGPGDRQKIAEGVMATLEDEGFFEFPNPGGSGGAAGDESGNGE